jgi:imidazole glycerol phosphate synthase subunit HisF
VRIGTTLLFKDGYCYQSYGWNLFRPLGELQNALNHLDQYELDEICIIRPVRTEDQTYHSDIDRLKKAKSSTPLAFGGGIRDYKDIEPLEGMPVERFILSSALFDSDMELIKRLHSKYGEQSIVGFIPFFFKEQLRVFCSSQNRFKSFDSLNTSLLKLCDEIVLHDCSAEGFNIGFNEEVVDRLGINENKLIYSGGVSDLIKGKVSLLNNPKSILVENKILHRENSKKSYYGAM